MKRRILVIVLLLVLILVVSCEKKTTKPDGEHDVVISSSAKVLDIQQIEAIAVVTEDQIQMSGQAETNIYNVGDLIVAEPFEQAPNGLLRRITQIQQEGDDLILTTEQARLEDVFEQADIESAQPLRTTDIRKTIYHVDGIQMVTGSKDPLTFEYILDYTNDTTIPGTTLGISGGLDLTMGYELSIKTRLTQGITYLKAGAFIGEESELQLDINTTIFDIEESIDLVTQEFQPIVFFVSAIPIVIVPRVTIVLNIDGEGSTNVTARVESSAMITAGLIFENRNWETYNSKNLSYEFTPPELQGRLSAEISAGPRFELNLYGITGPYVTGLGHMSLEADLQQDPWWTLRGGFKAGVGVKMDAIGYQVGHEVPALIEHSEILAEAEGGITGTLEGTVRNATGSVPLSDVSISIYRSSNPTELVKSATTDSNGGFSVELSGGTYKVVFSKLGFITATQFDVVVSGFETNTLQTILQIDETYQGTGEISGQISNALTGSGVGDVSLTLRSGINNVTGNIVATVLTGGNGQYSFSNIDAGNYTISCSKEEYISSSFSVICLGGQNSANQNATITPVLDESEVRIVLTWGETPRDLDSHLTGPMLGSSERFHVYYANRTYSHDGEIHAMLDRDDTSSYGPETTTIYNQSSGLYRFSIHDYTNRNNTSSYAMSNSSAQIMVWRGNALVRTYNVPNNQIGNVWTVFELVGNQILTINELSNNPQYKDGDVDWSKLPKK